MVVSFANLEQLYVYLRPVTCYHLPRPQASLLGRVRCALGYGINSVQFARRCGIDANEKSASRSAPEPSSLAPLFPRHTAFSRSAPGYEAVLSLLRHRVYGSSPWLGMTGSFVVNKAKRKITLLPLPILRLASSILVNFLFN